MPTSRWLSTRRLAADLQRADYYRYLATHKLPQQGY